MKLNLNNVSIGTIKTLADGSLKLDVYTRELSPESMLEIFKFKSREGEFDIAVNCDFEAEPKTKSQRLKAVIYKYWENQTDKSIDFEVYYNAKMEKIIESIKNNL